MSREKTLVKNTFILTVGKICTQLITFFLLPLYTAILSTEEYGTVDLTLFPNTYTKYNDIKKKDVIEIYGRVEKRFDKYQIIVNDVKIL